MRSGEEIASTAGGGSRKPGSSAIGARLSGPGGYYNIGNLIGLSASLSLQFANAGQNAGASLAETLQTLFAGSPGSAALTVATLIFLASGEVYHRAWRNGSPPDARLNRLADLMSAAGAVALSVSLIYLGSPGFAVGSGLAIALGKLGSAVFGDARAGWWPHTWSDPFRGAVLVGRMLSSTAVGLTLLDGLPEGFGAASIDEGAWLALVHPATLMVCHLLWMKADLLLLDGARPAPKAA